jgi:predicted GTPase
MGYGEVQLRELGATIRAAACDAVVVGTPVDLSRLVDVGHPVRRVTYDLREVGGATLAEVLKPYIERWTAGQR